MCVGRDRIALGTGTHQKVGFPLLLYFRVGFIGFVGSDFASIIQHDLHRQILPQSCRNYVIEQTTAVEHSDNIELFRRPANIEARTVGAVRRGKLQCRIAGAFPGRIRRQILGHRVGVESGTGLLSVPKPDILDTGNRENEFSIGFNGAARALVQAIDMDIRYR